MSWLSRGACARTLATLLFVAGAHQATATGPVTVGPADEETLEALESVVLGEGEGVDPWQPTAPDTAGGWLSTFLSEAGLHEEAFNLPAARHRYRQGCSLPPPPGAGAPWWDDRLAACEGLVDAAFALEDWETLDEALRALLRARPGHPFPRSRFPPLVISRAAELANSLPAGRVTIEGPQVAIQLDGVLLGLPPLRLPDVPAGSHRISCGDHSRSLEVEANGSVEVRCPTPDTLPASTAITDALASEGPTWFVVGAGVEGIDPGVWVFQGGADALGLRVEPRPGAGDLETWHRAAATARTR